MNLSTKQKKQLKRVADALAFEEKGAVTLLDLVFALEDKLDTDIPEIKALIDKVKSETLSKDEIQRMIDVVVSAIEMPKVVKGDKGDSYILTQQDKKEIASKIKAPVVEKKVIVEKTEVIREQPIEIIKEVAVLDENKLPQFGDKFRDGLELLPKGERLNINFIDGIDDYSEVARLAKASQFLNRGGNGKGLLSQLNDVNITNPTNGQSLEYNATTQKWENSTDDNSVTSVSNVDGTLTISPTTGDVIASLNLAHANTWTGIQTFNSDNPIYINTTMPWDNSGVGGVFVPLIEGGYSDSSGTLQMYWNGTETWNSTTVAGFVFTGNTSGYKNIRASTFYGVGASVTGDVLSYAGTSWLSGGGNDMWLIKAGTSVNGGLGLYWDSSAGEIRLQDEFGIMYPFTVGTITANQYYGIWNGTTIGAIYGGTGQSGVTTGDLLYGSASNTWNRLAGVATGNALISGGVSTAPSWGKIGLTTHISGTLPIANGGTNATSYGANRLIFMNSANTAFSSDSTLVFDGTNMGLGVSSPSAKLHVIKTSEQFRVGYDTSNYYSTTVGSTGIVTFNAVGSGSSFVFSDSVSTSGTLAQVGSASNTGYIRTNTSGSASTTNLNPGVAVFGGGGTGSMYGMDLGYNSTSSRYRTRIFTGSSSGDIAFSFALANPPTSQSNFTEVMVVYGGAGGRVGIGQPTPAAKFNVVDGVADFRFSSGSGSVTPTIAQLNTGASGKAIVFGAGTSGGYVGWDNAGDFYFKTETRTAINNNTSGAGPNVGVILSASGNWGLGTATPQARLHLEKTTEQFRSGYNSTNYWNATTSSTGVTTFDAVGSGASFIFSDSVNITSSLQCDSIVNDTGLAHGTYTPTLTGVTNVSSSTARECTYMRVGNTVTVAGQCDITPAANNTQTTIGISIPIASNFSTAYQAGGSGHSTNNTTAGHGASIIADATNDRVTMDYYETHGAGDTISFSFTYQVI